MALGAFVAGLLLAETEFRKAIETTIEPFKGLLLGLFFFTVGMGIDIRELARDPFWLLASVAGLIAIKGALVTGLARLFRVPLPAAIETGLLLGPGGEFAFVALGMATTLGLVVPTAASFCLAVTSLTMALIPLLALAARRITERLEKHKGLDPEVTAAPPPGNSGHAIVIGHGRVGQIVCGMLERHRFPFIATDIDPAAIAHYRRRGRQVYYGDAVNLAFLKSCGLMEAAAVIVTIHVLGQVVRIQRPDWMKTERFDLLGKMPEGATVGVLGSGDKLDFSALGDVVNTAARLQSNAEPGSVLVGEGTVKSVELERERGMLIWSFDITRNQARTAPGQLGRRVAIAAYYSERNGGAHASDAGPESRRSRP
jgi:hypothetical protein